MKARTRPCAAALVLSSAVAPALLPSAASAAPGDQYILPILRTQDGGDIARIY